MSSCIVLFIICYLFLLVNVWMSSIHMCVSLHVCVFVAPDNFPAEWPLASHGHAKPVV